MSNAGLWKRHRGLCRHAVRSELLREAKRNFLAEVGVTHRRELSLKRRRLTVVKVAELLESHLANHLSQGVVLVDDTLGRLRHGALHTLADQAFRCFGDRATGS